MTPTMAQMKDALDLALAMLIEHEPPDSRAVSNEFVAMASVASGDASEDVMEVIDNALYGCSCGGGYAVGHSVVYPERICGVRTSAVTSKERNIGK